MTTTGIRFCHTRRGLAGERTTSFFIRGGKVYRASVALVID